MSFDHMSFDHMSFDHMSLDPVSFDPIMSVNRSINTRLLCLYINVHKDQIFDFRKVYFKVEVYHKRFRIVEVISQGLEFISRLKGTVTVFLRLRTTLS